MLAPSVTRNALRSELQNPMLDGPALSQLVTLCHLFWLLALAAMAHGQVGVEMHVPVEGQPLSANVTRVLQALQFLGAPLTSDTTKQLEIAAQARDADRLQEL